MTSRGGLLNHSTSIEASKTIGEIQAILLRHGATKILIDALGGEITGIVFGLTVSGKELAFRLPSNVDACWYKLGEQYKQGRIEHRFTTRDQANRVAWRIIKDWVEAQVALIETAMVTPAEIFLPYLIIDGQHTVRDRLSEMIDRLRLQAPA